MRWKSWLLWRSSSCAALIFCLLALGSCEPSVVADKAATASPTYTLLKVAPNPALSKVNIEVFVPEKLKEEEVRQLALQLKAKYDGYTKTWIFYYLPGMKPGSGAWATTHFTPELEVTILGASQAQEQQVKQTVVPGKVLGSWYEEQYTQSSLVIYQQKERYRIKTTYKDGTSSDELLQRKGNTFTYAEVGSFNGEYFKLLPNGNLGLLNQEGKLFTQAKLTH